MENTIAKRENGVAHEMSEKNEILKVKFEFTEKQYHNILKGRLPIEFGDRWFIFCENNVVYFHYWQGQCIYTMRLDISSDKYIGTDIKVVKDEKVNQIRNNEVEISELIHLIKYSLLYGESFKVIK